MIDLAGVVAVVGFCLIANLISRDYTLIPALAALVYVLDPLAGAFAAMVTIFMIGTLVKFIKAGKG